MHCLLFVLSTVALLLSRGAAAGFPTITSSNQWVAAFLTTNNKQRTNQRIYYQTSALFGKRMKFQPPPRVVSQTECIAVQPDGEDAWKTMDVVALLEQGGVGVVPTDTGYGFVTPLSSKAGLERLLRIKGMEQCKKPLSLLCSNLGQIDEFCYGIDKMAFKILKKNFPGLYTFILPAKTTLPKGIMLDSKGGKHSWKRHTLGVRMPTDPVLRYLQDELLDGMPLLVSSLPVEGVDDNDDYADNVEIEESRRQNLTAQCYVDKDASWCNEVDFIIDAGPRPNDGSTIYDLTTRGEPTLIREGLGELELAL